MRVYAKIFTANLKLDGPHYTAQLPGSRPSHWSIGTTLCRTAGTVQACFQVAIARKANYSLA